MRDFWLELKSRGGILGMMRMGLQVHWHCGGCLVEVIGVVVVVRKRIKKIDLMVGCAGQNCRPHSPI